MKTGDTSLGGPLEAFPQTVAEFVMFLRDGSPEVRQAGLEELSRRYWKPVYHCLRAGWGKSNEDAKDLTQAFFLWLVEEGGLRRYEPGRASFRTFLKALLRHFVQHADEASARLKRGGKARVVELNPALPDPLARDPERAFEEAWRDETLRRAHDRVRDRLLEGEGALKYRVFEAYDLAPAGDRPTYQAVAGRFGLKETDVHNYLFAVREEIRSEVRAQLAQAASEGADLEEEWDDFFRA
jgi:RNA polymerase sigma-70 factor (ECF subfamily)